MRPEKEILRRIFWFYGVENNESPEVDNIFTKENNPTLPLKLIEGIEYPEYT
ncbi:hypothetical protein HDC33_000675 [Sporosarcina sp. JAI121]|nr:hypothetical protein [Sporosarcina sp. JAI121]